jgi:3-oxoacyl-[acyl-carrier-protein] synthase-3
MLFIHGIGHFHPENVIDNAFLDSLNIQSDTEWILERVGIHQRRTVLPLDYIRNTRNIRPADSQAVSLYSNAQTGAKAAELALQRAGIQPSDIGMVISGGCSPLFSIPAEACIIAAEMGIQATCFDLNSSCSKCKIIRGQCISMIEKRLFFGEIAPRRQLSLLEFLPLFRWSILR